MLTTITSAVEHNALHPVGTVVDVIGGTYEGHIGSVKRYTAKRVGAFARNLNAHARSFGRHIGRDLGGRCCLYRLRSSTMEYLFDFLNDFSIFDGLPLQVAPRNHGTELFDC
jgi:hypothetical protein